MRIYNLALIIKIQTDTTSIPTRYNLQSVNTITFLLHNDFIFNLDSFEGKNRNPSILKSRAFNSSSIILDKSVGCPWKIMNY